MADKPRGTPEERPAHPATVGQRRAPHPATAAQPKPASKATAERPRHAATGVQRSAPHPATVGQRRAPHPATAAQPKPASKATAERPPHAATGVQRRRAPEDAGAERPPHPATVIQPADRRPTATGLKTEHAEKVYKNYLKGDPPFKPQKGNFGHVSWFAGSGNAYVGGQTQSYTVTVDVDLKQAPRRLDKDFFRHFVAKYIKTTGVDLEDPLTHGEFWKALGAALESEGLAEVYVPQGPWSRQGDGTFIVANASARGAVALGDPSKLRQDLASLNVDVDALEKAVTAKNTTHDAWFQVRFPSVKKSHIGTNLPTFLAGVGQALKWPGFAEGATPTVVQHVKTAVPSNATLVEKLRGDRWDVVLKLTFADYLTARRRAKNLATIAARAADITNDFGGLVITAPPGWSATATRAYDK